MSIRKKLLTVLIALVLLALLVVGLMPAPIPVSVTEVVRGPFAEVVEDEGRTRLRDPYLVAAPLTGYLQRVELEPGDPVTSGDVVFRLEATPAPALDARAREQAREAISAARARVEAAEAELDSRRIQHQLTQLEYQRNRQLFEARLISAEQMDRVTAQRDAGRTAERSARHAVDVARFELESARAVLEVADGERAPGDQPTFDAHAPVSGTVTQRHRYSEGPVSAGEGILEIGDLGDLEVRVDLLSMDAVRVRPGMRVILERWGGDGDLEGVVRRVEPGGFTRVSALGVDEQRVPVRVDITSDRETWEQLGDGYRVEARFILWEGEEVLQVPTSALFRSDDRWAVFVAGDRQARLRHVEVGRRSGLRSQILEGLEAGERVITHPGDRITDGTRITAEDNTR